MNGFNVFGSSSEPSSTKWWQSKTLWFQAIAIALAAAAQFLGLLPGEVTWAIAAKSAIDVLLRIVTTKPLSA